MAETYSAGIVTAYGAAVRGGYTGTYEQFCAEQAQFGANAAKVAQDRAAVEAATQTFTTVTVPGAVQAVQQTGATQVQAVEAASETEQQQIALAGAAQETRVTQAGDDQVDAVEEAGATQVGNVNTAGTTQVGNVNTAGTTQVGNVNTAGTTQVGAVNTAGATQVQAVEDKGQEVIGSIPSDYTDLTEDVADLKSVLNGVTETITSKNLFATSNLSGKSGITYSDGVFAGQALKFTGTYMANAFDENTQYTVQITAKNTGTSANTNGLYFGFKYSDNTNSNVYFTNDTTAYEKKTLISTAGKNVVDFHMGYASSGSNVWNVTKLQIEKGAYATQYVSPDAEVSATDEVARSKIRPWYAAFEKEPLKIAYSLIWIDKANTSTHWLLAADMGFNALKGDVEITSDGELIMCHDPGFTFDSNGRITTYDSSNKTLIVNMTYDECRAKVYADNPTRYGDYCPVADIDDFIQICKDKGKICFVTIRATNTAAVVSKLVSKIKYYGMESRTIINALTFDVLSVVRSNSDADEIAVNYVAPENTAITNAQVDACLSIGKCMLTAWWYDSMASLADTIAYAKSKNVPVCLATINSVSRWNALIKQGMIGAQIIKPIFDVEPKNYRFKVTVDDEIATFGNLFASDRFTATLNQSGTTVTVSDVKITGSNLTGVIDGIMPIKMNMLNPAVRCVDNAGNTIPCVWSNNAFVLTLSNTNDNTYTVIVDV